MMRFKRVLALLLAAGIAATMAGCKSNKGKEALNTDRGVDTSQFVTLSHYVLGDPPKTDQLGIVQAKWNELMKSKINAHMEMKWIEWADWSTKYNLLLASGEAIDLVATSSTWLDLWPNAQKGAFKALDDLLPKYAPKTYSEVSKDEWEMCKYNGKIVAIPENSYTQWVNHGIYYRGDWAKEFGITEPIKTWEGLTKYFQGIKDKKPGVIPWDVNGTKMEATDGWFVSDTDGIMIDSVPTGFSKLFYAKSYNDRYTIYSPYFEDSLVKYAKLMKEWADKGFWREDVLNYKGDTRELLKAGQTGADQHHTQTYLGLRTDMDKKQPGSELQMFAFSDTRGNLISQPITHGATSIGVNSKNPERALMAYELIRQDQEIYKLVNYGIQGVQYEIKDGKRVQPSTYDETKHQFYSNFWGGRVDKFEIPSVNTFAGYKEIYAKYDKIKHPFPYGRFVFNKQPIEPELAAISDVMNQLMPAIAWGKAGDPQKAVDQLRTKLKSAGYDKVLKEVQKQMTDYKKLIEGK